MMPVFEADMVRKGRAVRFVWLYPKGYSLHVRGLAS